MNFSALYSSIIVAYPLKISMSSDKLNVLETSSVHYANMSVQYTAIFHGYKNDYFQMKNCISFLIFAKNIDCGYTLEPPH